MNNNFDYIKKLKNQTQKKKSITITIDENVLDKLTNIADSLELSKNQIITDISNAFVNDYENLNTPDYYIINSNNAYMPEGHLHMLRGNRASAWGDTKNTIEGLKPGDYVFIYMNEKGVVGAGTVKSGCMVNDYSVVKCYANEKGTEFDYDVWDEYFVTIEYDKVSLKLNNDGNYIIDTTNTIKASEYREKVSTKPLNRTKVNLNKKEGYKLKELYLNK